MFGLLKQLKLSFVSRLLVKHHESFPPYGPFLFILLGHSAQQPYEILSNSLQNNKPTVEYMLPVFVLLHSFLVPHVLDKVCALRWNKISPLLQYIGDYKQ